MQYKQTLKWIASLSTSAVLALVLADACITPADHDVHSPNGISIKGEIADPLESVPSYYGPLRPRGPIRPSQSIADIRCQVWRQNASSQCPDDSRLAPSLWPHVEQRPNILYVGLLPSCPGYFNIEYLSNDRTVTIHCHVAWPWISIPTGARGVVAIRETSLIVVPTDAIAPGALRVVQDDRVEHLIGDQTTETDLGTVTIT